MSNDTGAKVEVKYSALDEKWVYVCSMCSSTA
jgi:hypothetical protein